MAEEDESTNKEEEGFIDLEKIKELESKIKVLEWDVKRDQINPAKKHKLEKLKQELAALKAQMITQPAVIEEAEYVENPFVTLDQEVDGNEEELNPPEEEKTEDEKESKDDEEDKSETEEKKDEKEPEEVDEYTEDKNSN